MVPLPVIFPCLSLHLQTAGLWALWGVLGAWRRCATITKCPRQCRCRVSREIGCYFLRLCRPQRGASHRWATAHKGLRVSHCKRIYPQVKCFPLRTQTTGGEEAVLKVNKMCRCSLTFAMQEITCTKSIFTSKHDPTRGWVFTSISPPLGNAWMSFLNRM